LPVCHFIFISKIKHKKQKPNFPFWQLTDRGEEEERGEAECEGKVLPLFYLFAGQKRAAKRRSRQRNAAINNKSCQSKDNNSNWQKTEETTGTKRGETQRPRRRRN